MNETKDLKMIKDFMRMLEGAKHEETNRVCARFIYQDDENEINSDSFTLSKCKEFEIVLDLNVKFHEKGGTIRAKIKCEEYDGESDQGTLDYACECFRENQYLLPHRQQWIIFHELYRNQWLAMRMDHIFACEPDHIIISNELLLFDVGKSVTELAAIDLLKMIHSLRDH